MFLTQKQGHNAVLPVVVDFYYHFGGNVFVNKLALLRHHLLKALPKSHCKQINRRDTGLYQTYVNIENSMISN